MIDEPITLFWFRRDLRLNDNHGLYRAFCDADNVQALFVFDTGILGKLEDADDRRVSFLHDRLKLLHSELSGVGATLWTEHGDPAEVFRTLINKWPVGAVYTNHDHEPYAQRRDDKVRALLGEKGIPLHSFKDQSLFEREEVVKADGTPYTVYTPYMRRWRTLLDEQGVPSFPSEDHLSHLRQSSDGVVIDLDRLGFTYAEHAVPGTMPSPLLLKNYADDRNTPSLFGTSRIGVHLRFGTVSVRDMVRVALVHSSVWLNELIWREFFMQVLWHFPHVEHGSFRKAYDAIPWRDDEEQFNAWCEGRTGYPLVDAGMRELRETGFMHNRVRMVVASFLTKHLLIDWRWGEAWFARWLMDLELSSNNGNWQWAAGCGCDAAPYFRVFNPALQMKRFDPRMEYVQRWAPEYLLGKAPAPIVEHKQARQRALTTYRLGLG